MARKRDIEVSISPDGRVQVHVKGMPGKQCLKVRQLLEEVLGPLESQRLTSEYYDPEEDQPVSLEIRER
ncbi:MAG: DUF2997 domain-containing protein [Firmicutes bacterium]|nr:DUF2997 domain-containing protein [Bacillota bacterium]